MISSLVRRFFIGATVILVISTTPALPQGRPAAKDVEISHGGDFFRDRTEVPGTIRNASRSSTYPCLNVLFMFERNGRWEAETMKITGLRAGESRRYTHRTGPSNAVIAQGAFPCADPIVADAGGNCTVVGALIEPASGFRQVIRQSPGDRGTPIALDSITMRDATTLDLVGGPARRQLDHRKHLMFYSFSNVPVGRELEIWLSYGWEFGGRETVKFRCERGGQKLDLGTRRVQAAAGD